MDKIVNQREEFTNNVTANFEPKQYSERLGYFKGQYLTVTIENNARSFRLNDVWHGSSRDACYIL